MCVRERSDVFLWMRCVMQLADCLLAVPQSSRHASPADSALWKKEREGRNFRSVSDIRRMRITRLSLGIFKHLFHTRDLNGIPREVLVRDAHSITLYRTAYACIKSCPCGCWKIQQHSFIPQTRNVRPFLAKASCSQTSHCLQGDEQNACTWRVSKWESVAHVAFLYKSLTVRFSAIYPLHVIYFLGRAEALKLSGLCLPLRQVLCHRQLRIFSVLFSSGEALADLDFHSKVRRLEEGSNYFPAEGTETQANTGTVKVSHSH